MQAATNAAGSFIREYRPRLYGQGAYRTYFRWIYPLLMFVCFVANLIAHRKVSAVLLALILLLYPFTWRVMLRTRLVVTPTGIAYHLPGGTLYAGWQDIAGYGRRQGWRGWGTRGLLLRHCKWKPSGRMRWQGRWVGGYIPLTSSMGPFWERGLESDLRRFAPWLYDPAAFGGAVPPLSGEDERRGWMRYGLFVAALSASAMVAAFIGVALRWPSPLIMVFVVVLDIVLVFIVSALTRRR